MIVRKAGRFEPNATDVDLPNRNSTEANSNAVNHAVLPIALNCEGDCVNKSLTRGHRVQNGVDWARVRELLDTCTPGNHGYCAPLDNAQRPLPANSRVLDVEDESWRGCQRELLTLL
jgi:hypothetical protein